MKKIILDTNFLLIPGQFGVDIFSGIDLVMDEPYELYVLDLVVSELEKLAAGVAGGGLGGKPDISGKDKAAAKLGLKLLKSKNVTVTPSLKTEKHLNTDKMIVEIAKSPDYIVATQDKALKQVLKSNGVRILVLRQKKQIMLI